MLAREVLILRGNLKKDSNWSEVMVDLFISRNLEKIKDQQEQAKREELEAKEKDEPKEDKAPIKASDVA